MFDKLFESFQRERSVEETDADEALALAFAALMVEAAHADEDYEAHEAAIIDRALKKKFGLDDAGAAALRGRAEAAQESATDIQRFTKVAKTMTREDKIALIEELWEVVLADGKRDPYEDTLIRRICGLIYVDDQDSGAARTRAAARLDAN